MTNDNKTPDYTRRAVDKYNSKFDRISANMPRGFRDRVAAVSDSSAAAFVVAAALEKLERLEAEKEKK